MNIRYFFLPALTLNKMDMTFSFRKALYPSSYYFLVLRQSILHSWHYQPNLTLFFFQEFTPSYRLKKDVKAWYSLTWYIYLPCVKKDILLHISQYQLCSTVNQNRNKSSPHEKSLLTTALSINSFFFGAITVTNSPFLGHFPKELKISKALASTL